jgi:flagellar biosynthesis protein FlhB
MNPFGNIDNPFSKLNPNSALNKSTDGQGLVTLGNSLLKFVIVLAGLYTFWNFIAAGYGFMSAGDDAKAMGKAWEKFTSSLLGLLFVAGSFVLAAIFGQLIFGDYTMLLSPRIYTP